MSNVMGSHSIDHILWKTAISNVIGSNLTREWGERSARKDQGIISKSVFFRVYHFYIISKQSIHWCHEGLHSVVSFGQVYENKDRLDGISWAVPPPPAPAASSRGTWTASPGSQCSPADLNHKEMPGRMPEWMVETMPNRMPEKMPERMSKHMPERMPEWMVETMPDRMPEKMPERMSKHMPERIPEWMIEMMPDRMPEKMPERMSKHMPEWMVETMPDRMPEKMPERMSKHMPERMPEWMVETMPDRMPEKMPERMSKHMPERMQERMSTTTFSPTCLAKLQKEKTREREPEKRQSYTKMQRMQDLKI